MITAQKESFTHGIDELSAHLDNHYQELALNKDSVPLSPQFDIYIKREALGELIYVTLRERGKLIGYYIGFVAPGLHYSTCLTCTTDIFYIDEAYRGNGGATVLFSFVEKELKNRGVDRWFIGSKCHKDASKLFERLKFEKVEIYYSKMLDKE